MNERINLAVAAVSAVALGMFISILVRAVWYAPEAQFAPIASAPASAFAAGTTTAAEEPARLIIPSLNIHANVQYVGLSAAGTMGVPNNFTDTAWYEYGPAPGEVGSAVIDGHVDNGLSLAGVFKHLSDVQPGALVEVVTKGGTTLTFKVSEVDLYPYQSVPVGKVFGQTDAARLNLITCDGAWVESGRTYDHRLVVYTTFVSSS